MKPIRRLTLVAGMLPLALLAASCSKPAEAAPIVTVYKTPTCGCCKSWVEHLEEHGFEVKTVDQTDLSGIKRQHGVPAAMESCHTGVVAGYAVEGHVPADVIRRLLKERPPVKGIAVPGMPQGSPGMETGVKEPYEVYTFDRTGPKDIYEAR